uniref:Uncharacterized protein n=1 Tax=Bartonella schoenbuchensis (strain DSM 13525 / NCTC 13165 / R1) TaxID=687861 RepID=E6Z160_BARSR|nr:hypothetical protein BARSC_190119 [Bartonella schoenbuchensis R1]
MFRNTLCAKALRTQDALCTKSNFTQMNTNRFYEIKEKHTLLSNLRRNLKI